jgi:hypothetical protein
MFLVIQNLFKNNEATCFLLYKIYLKIMRRHVSCYIEVVKTVI